MRVDDCVVQRSDCFGGNYYYVGKLRLSINILYIIGRW